jgi:endo-1,3(4)-beta-glucanase
VPLVRGMAFVSMIYDNLTPHISTIHAILEINGQSVQPGDEFSGSKFSITMNNGQTWLIYTTGIQVGLTYTGTGLDFNSAFTGTIRTAYVPNSGAEAIFDAYAETIPIGKDLKLPALCGVERSVE